MAYFKIFYSIYDGFILLPVLKIFYKNSSVRFEFDTIKYDEVRYEFYESSRKEKAPLKPVGLRNKLDQKKI